MMMEWCSLRLPKRVKDLFMERVGEVLSYQKGDESLHGYPFSSLSPRADSEQRLSRWMDI